jgi:hypothetical protein
MNALLACAQAWYMRIFRLQEIADDMILRWFGGAILLGFHASFRYWQTNPATTLEGMERGNTVCWPFFQNCTDWIWLQTLPAGYSQMVLFMGLFALIVFAAIALIQNRIVVAHFCIFLLFLAKLYFTLINFFYNANYDYYHTVFTLIFLFAAHRRFFGALSVVMLYFLSTATKIHPSWTLGTYFSTLNDGLPIFPNGTEPFFTNLVIFMEMIMVWFLFSHKRWLQKTVFAFFFIFHLYSGTLVGYHYPTMVMPALIIFFGPYFRPFDSVPRDKKSLIGWLLLATLLGIQAIPQLIKGDAKLTLEGNFYGIYMFEANHQCALELSNPDGTLIRRRISTNARFRCDPWPYFSVAKRTYCHADSGDTPIHFRLIHSINGGPFYEIVNAPNLCDLEYRPFTHNTWIKDETTAPIVGRPVKNYYL